MTLTEIISDSFSLKPEQQSNDVAFNTLDTWESMAHMLFITRVEENFAVEFTGDEILAIRTIGDIKKILAEKGVNI